MISHRYLSKNQIKTPHSVWYWYARFHFTNSLSVQEWMDRNCTWREFAYVCALCSSSSSWLRQSTEWEPTSADAGWGGEICAASPLWINLNPTANKDASIKHQLRGALGTECGGDNAPPGPPLITPSHPSPSRKTHKKQLNHPFADLNLHFLGCVNSFHYLHEGLHIVVCPGWRAFLKI